MAWAGTAIAQSESREADGIAARLIHRELPEYPRIARMKGVEGWVLVGYTVSEIGRPEDVTIIDTSIEGYFEDAAARAVRLYRFEPASFLGEPVSQGGMSERIFFILSSQGWDTDPSFRERYSTASRTIREGPLDVARTLIDDLADEPSEWLAEAFYLDLLELKYARAIGDRRATERHLERALVVAKEKAPAPVYQGLLRDAVGIRGESADYREALAAYETLLAAAPSLPADDPARSAAADMRARLAESEPIERERMIERCDACSPPVTVWSGSLNRQQFSIVPVSGEVHDIEVSCGVHSVSFLFRADTVWRLDPRWQDCRARIYGEDGAVFRLVEPASGPVEGQDSIQEAG